MEDITNTVIEKIDILADVANPQELPWIYEDGSIKEFVCAGVLEYIPGKLRGKFFDEIYRILAPGGTIAITVPYWHSALGIQDYMYEWPPLSEQSFLYFNKGWREANKVPHTLTADFDFTYGYTPIAEVASRSEETRAFQIKHYTNSVQLVHIMMTKK